MICTADCPTDTDKCWLFDVVNRYVLCQPRARATEEKKGGKGIKEDRKFSFSLVYVKFSFLSFEELAKRIIIVSSRVACIFLLQISLVVPF